MKHLKLSLAFLLAAALVMSFGTAAFAEEGSAAAEGLDETVTVTVTVDDGKITGVEAVTDKEEETVGRQALTEIPAAMLEANPVLKKMYGLDDGKFEVLSISDAKADICSFTGAPVHIEF